MPNKELENLYAEFHLHPVLQPEQSHKEGRPIYKDEVYVKIQIKDQKNQVRDRKMRDEDKDDFPSAWERWTRKEKAASIGTPLTAIPGCGPSMVLELNGFGVMTVEDLANLTDAGCQNFRGGYMFRQRAQAYLKAAEIKPEPEEKTEPEENTDDPVDVAAMKSSPNVIPAPRRGRPRKTAGA